ncbi:COP23 domain-containing protein [Okeania sp. SIO2B3]|uniref:COP23 domain-containing protein n=1 Tax=Okeania sp. SIO2B3 TaxID=2607784 RepID=UPI0013BEE897|nr:COP23 domain-containing protein [Okeania sp. SIO2B3]NET45439.1 hypothetical protein [Okeania sp. SIO2B3]
MKHLSKTAIILVATLGAAACSNVSNPLSKITNSEPEVSYACITDSSGTPTTVAQGKQRGDIPIIRWTSNFGSGAGYTPQSRCEEVSANFQKYYKQGVLNYITTGQKNNYDIICVSNELGGGCLNDASKGQLWTLKSEDNASEVIPKVFDVGYMGSAPLSQTDGSDGSVIIRQGSQVYLDINKHLQQAPTMR